MALFPLLTYVADRPDDYREQLLKAVKDAMKCAVREAYDKGVEDGRKWIGNGIENPYQGREIEAELGGELFDFVRKFASPRTLPGCVKDMTSFDDIAEALDAAEIPRTKNGTHLTLIERVSDLAYKLEEEQGYNEELRAEAGTVSAEFEGDLWKANRNILDRLGFDWSMVDSDGVTADTVEIFIIDGITRLERKARPAKRPLAIANLDVVNGGSAADPTADATDAVGSVS
jgi:hypothetical protein